MRFINILYKGVFLFLFPLFLSCDNFVEVDLPTSQLTTETVFENPATASAAMADVYSKLRGSGLLTGQASGMSCQLGHYSDELTYYGPAGLSTENFYKNSLLPTDNGVLEWWNTSFNQIYAVNAILNGLNQSNTLEEEFKRQLSGEALFVRGMLHFYLAQLYGEIPYITTTDYRVNSNVNRMPLDEVYMNIESDLIHASEQLSMAYSDTQRTKPNSATAMALLSRVYLYQDKWSEAEAAASSVISQGELYTIGNDLTQVFKIDSPSTIWQFASPLPGENAAEAATFIFTQGPPPLTALTENFIEAFEPGDMRKEIWTKPVSDGTVTWYHANKYTNYTNTGSSIEFSVIFRLAEQYLIRSEARANQGNITGAREDLNIVRNMAQLPENSSTTSDDILNAIAHERRVELFTEFGHRFFDLKRTNRINMALSPVKEGWNNEDMLLPLPERELLVNPQLNPQNPGY